MSPKHRAPGGEGFPDPERHIRIVPGLGEGPRASPAAAAAEEAGSSVPTDRWAGPLRTPAEYEDFYVEERPAVLRFIVRHHLARGWDASTIHDVAQEAWAAVYNKLGRIDKARPYLYRTIRNKITDEYRHRVRIEPADDLDTSLRTTGGAVDDPVDLVAARETALIDVHPAALKLLEAIWLLPERQRMAYQLRVGEHLTSVAIAKILGDCTPDAVNNLVNRARGVLIERFGRERVTWFEAGEWRWPE